MPTAGTQYLHSCHFAVIVAAPAARCTCHAALSLRLAIPDPDAAESRQAQRASACQRIKARQRIKVPCWDRRGWQCRGQGGKGKSGKQKNNKQNKADAAAGNKKIKQNANIGDAAADVAMVCAGCSRTSRADRFGINS
jgi:hypothetical protein